MKNNMINFESFRDWKRDKIYEGLILTHPLNKVIEILKNKFKDTENVILKVNNKNNSFNITYLFDNNQGVALSQLIDLYSLINASYNSFIWG